MKKNNIIEMAKVYLSLGIYPIPIEPGTKTPDRSGWNKLRIDVDELKKYFDDGQQLGVLLGIAPIFLADLDIDDNMALSAVAGRMIPGQPKTDWSFGHKSKPVSHFIYKTAKEFKSIEFADDIDKHANTARGEKESHTIIEIRGTNGQTVFPPSAHKSGEPITWTVAPAATTIGETSVAALESYAARVAAAVLLARHYPSLSQGHTLALTFSGWLAVNNWREEDVASIVTAAATIARDPDVRERRRNVSSTYSRVSTGNETITQRGHLEELLGAHGKKICRTIAKWLGLTDESTKTKSTADAQSDSDNTEYCEQFYRGRIKREEITDTTFYADAENRWHVDATNHTMTLIEEAFYKRRADLATSTLTGKAFSQAVSWANKSLDTWRIAACQRLWFARPTVGIQPLPGETSYFDTNRMLFGVKNGIIDLQTNELLPGRLDLYVAKRAPVVYDPDAKCPEFEKYLEEVQPNPEIRNFLIEFAGVCLTGWQLEPCLLFFYGTGANGKTVFVMLLRAILGDDYQFAAKKEMFFGNEKSRDVGDNDKMDIAGKRLLTASEAEESLKVPKWNLGMIKTLFGGETLHGRQLYSKGTNFIPHAKGIVSMNLSPQLSGFGEALSRRFLKVPWDVTVPPKKRIRPVERFIKKLTDNGGASGILNLFLDGLKRVREREWEIIVPSSLRESTDEYFEDSDLVRKFFREWCEESDWRNNPTADRFVDTKVFYDAFVAWLNEPAGKFTLKKRKFTMELKRVIGPERIKFGNGNVTYVFGFRLTADAEREVRTRKAGSTAAGGFQWEKSEID